MVKCANGVLRKEVKWRERKKGKGNKVNGKLGKYILSSLCRPGDDCLQTGFGLSVANSRGEVMFQVVIAGCAACGIDGSTNAAW